MRSLYLAGLLYAAVCGAVLLPAGSSPRRGIGTGGEPVTPQGEFSGEAGTWYVQVKPFCNALEVDTRIQSFPPPSGRDGAGYAAACYALAGRVDRAREVIAGQPQSDRGYAAWIVFNIGHPVADAGDDRSAGPIMELVLEFWPDNYMALYHAGMSEYALGQPDQARTRLRQFLELYRNEDGWRRNALEVLARLEGPER